MKQGGGKGGKGGDEGTGDLFRYRWVGRDHFGSRELGEEAARGATPEEWYVLWYMGWEWRIKEGLLPISSQDVTDMIGLPQEYGGHPSMVGANTDKTAELFGLLPCGTVKARGRHQHHNTLWDFTGIEVEM